MCVFVYINAGMLDCPASDQSGTRMKKLTMPGQVRYQTKPRQSGIFLVWNWTEAIDAGMPMPALVSSGGRCPAMDVHQKHHSQRILRILKRKATCRLHRKLSKEGKDHVLVLVPDQWSESLARDIGTIL
jgi:hypothetical protein